MSELLGGFIGACIAATAGLLVVGIVAFIERRVRLTGPHAEATEEHGKQLAQLRPLVVMLITVQKPQLIALLAILDALKEQVDGDYERTYKGVQGALDMFDATLMGIMSGECGEKKP